MLSIHGKPQEPMDLWKMRVYGEEVKELFRREAKPSEKLSVNAKHSALDNYSKFFLLFFYSFILFLIRYLFILPSFSHSYESCF